MALSRVPQSRVRLLTAADAARPRPYAGRWTDREAPYAPWVAESSLPERPALAVSREEAAQVLDEHIADGEKLVAAGDLYWVQWEEWRDRWKRSTTDGLRSIYANDSAASEFRDVADRFLMSLHASQAQELAYNRETVGKAVNVLRSLKERLRYLPEPSPVATEAPAPRPEPLDQVVEICSRLPVVARQLSRRHGGRNTLEIQDEYDVQDLLHSLLLVEFDDVRDESNNPKYLGKGTRIDLLLPRERVAIEVKMTRSTLSEGELGSQLAEDITRYADPDANRGVTDLVLYIHDPTHQVANPSGFCHDLERASDRLRIRAAITN